MILSFVLQVKIKEQDKTSWRDITGRCCRISKPKREAAKRHGVTAAYAQEIYLVPVTGIYYRLYMQIAAKKRLKKFWERHPRAKLPLETWHAIVSKAEWKRPADIKSAFGATIDFVADNRVVFDISGNSYRLVVHISYEYKAVLIKFIGTHSQYDKIDVETVS